jgi:hypothetical protein
VQIETRVKVFQAYIFDTWIVFAAFCLLPRIAAVASDMHRVVKPRCNAACAMDNTAQRLRRIDGPA